MRTYLRDGLGRFSSENTSLYKYDADLIDYLTNNSGLEFMNDFWNIAYSKKDESMAQLFSEFIKLRSKSYGADRISKELKVSKSTISKWIWKTSIPEIIRFLGYYTQLNRKNKLENYKWLSLNASRGGIFTGAWISIPEEINSYKDIKSVIIQIIPNDEFHTRARRFNILTPADIKLRMLLFAYLLGVMVGDAGKVSTTRKRRISRRITLSLTQKYNINERFGEFICLCANNLGLHMNRIKDDGPNIKSKHNFYRWASQSSQLVQWLFKVCLGLEDGELTTYHPVKVKWIFNMPREFRIWFLQGVADSDGYVDFCTHRAGIATRPNRNLIAQLFQSFSINCKTSKVHAGTMSLVTVNARDAYSLPLFNPYVQHYRYSQIKDLCEARRFSHHWPAWLGEKVNNYIKQDMHPSVIIRKVLKEDNIAIKQSSIYKRKMKMSDKKLVCLGIESTAL